MNTFVSAIANQESRTMNDMKARKSTASACVDLFYKIGASRGKDIIPDFVAAYVNNPEVALRIAQWGRDVRGGAGERQIYRDIMKYLENSGEWDALMAMMQNTAEIGRWDDLLIFSSEKAKAFAFGLIESAMETHQKYITILNRINEMSDDEATLLLNNFQNDTYAKHPN